jgi:hypothetical protein
MCSGFMFAASLSILTPARKATFPSSTISVSLALYAKLALG